ncbi:MAG: signal peptidase I [Candidatus Parcubacteria bacterium]|nr:signal peptidase I [Candidatus Parcubacteria bacterium]
MFKNTLIYIWEVAKIVIIAMLIVVPIRYFIFQPFLVKGQSMEPSFENGDYLIVDEISYRFTAPKRGDVIVFKYPNNPSQRYIKRIIGLPGETIEIKDGRASIIDDKGNVKILDEAYLPLGLETPGIIKTTMGPNELFVMGDNRAASSDSRRWGKLDEKFIIGKVAIRAWPFAALAMIEAPAY